jgi:hypothetical protein
MRKIRTIGCVVCGARIPITDSGTIATTYSPARKYLTNLSIALERNRYPIVAKNTMLQAMRTVSSRVPILGQAGFSTR